MEFITKSKRISHQELTYLVELMSSGLPVRSCFELADCSGTDSAMKKLAGELDRGKMIEEVIEDYVPHNISSYLSCLMKILPFAKALELSLDFYRMRKDSYERVSRDLVYPLVMLSVSLTVLFLFDRFGLDTIISLLSGFGSNGSGILVFRTVFRIISIFCFSSFVLGCLAAVYFADRKRIELFYVLLSGYWPNSPFHIFFCEEFVSLFVVCLRNGFKTKDALEILRSLKNRNLVSFLAFHLDKELLEGKTLDEASDQEYYDSTLIRFIRIACYASDFCSVLESYVEFSRKKMTDLLKKATLGLQLFSYAMISLIVVFIYQVLFMPMQAIAAM